MRQVQIKKTINADAKRIFEAWTQPELMCRWFYPGNMTGEAENDLRVGGSYRLVMRDEESEHPHHGEYQVIDPFKKLVFTWNSKVVQNTRVTVELAEVASGTELTLTHEFIESDDLREKHNQGWNGCLINLERFLT